MPFKTYKNWLFDGNPNSPIPKPQVSEDGKVLVPDICKSSSPISHVFAISMFLKHLPFTHYMDKVFNNVNLWYLPKDELFTFIKKCVHDFRLTRRHTVFYPRRKTDKVVQLLEQKLPQLKFYEIELLAEIIENSPDRQSIYQALGLDVPRKQKVNPIHSTKKSSDKKMQSNIPFKKIIEDHFAWQPD